MSTIWGEQQPEITLGDWAVAAIGHHFGKAVAAKKRALAEPEGIHQMRVSLRRLRTAASVFGVVAELPKGCFRKGAKRLALGLGRVRDLDVLIGTVTQTYQPLLPPAEAQALQKWLQRQQGQRAKRFQELEALLTGPVWQEFYDGIAAWLAAPKLRAIARMPLAEVLPALLLPLLSQWLLHPAWTLTHEEWEAESADLHDLRKQFKRLRYQLEFCREFYGEALGDSLQKLQAAQDVLGAIQDRWVLRQVLGKAEPKFPALMELWKQHQNEDWQTWQAMRWHDFNGAFRHQVQRLLAEPVGSPTLG